MTETRYWISALNRSSAWLVGPPWTRTTVPTPSPEARYSHPCTSSPSTERHLKSSAAASPSASRDIRSLRPVRLVGAPASAS